jgi:amino acid adenylation domain-containing protein
MIALSHDIPSLVSLHAARSPQRPAISAGAVTIDYATLDARANAVTTRLRSMDVGHGSVVVVCMQRSIAAVVAALGVMRSGAAFLPLDPAHPAERTAFTIADAGAEVILATGARELERRGFHTVHLTLDGTLPATGRAFEPVKIGPADLAYMIYTSGSTGTPKGVELTHGGLSALVQWHVDAFTVGESDRASHLAAVGFDAAVWEVWPYLAAGACIHIVPPDLSADADALGAWLVEHAITLAFAPTPLAERLMHRTWPAEIPLRFLLTGGDRLRSYPPATLPFRVVNNYGPTECTVVATSGLVPPGPCSTPPPIGRAIAGTTVTVVGPDGRRAPDGTAGELWIGGAGVARGYRHRPELNDAKFVPDPFSPDPNGRIFRTGDRGRVLPDGQIEFIGRLDDQLKIRGFRIEPGEIESVLNAHPAVRASAVVASPGASGDDLLVAYIVAAAQAPSVEELRAFAGDRLPDYMIPARFVNLTELPENDNGKIDRELLRNRPADEARGVTFVEPATPTEKQLTQIMAVLLNMERVGVDDDFFELGGHSLLGTQLIARVHDAFGVKLTLRDIFRATTVAALALEVQRPR